MRDLREHDVDMPTIGPYLQPSEHHLPVRSYVHPDTFKMYGRKKRTRWASRTQQWARWCAPATTPICRRMEPAWCKRLALCSAGLKNARTCCGHFYSR